MNAPVSTGSAALDEITEVIGVEAAIKLAETLGGQRLYISRCFAPNHPVVKLIGTDAAALLSEHFHQTSVIFPSKNRRHAMVRALARQRPPLTRQQIAARVGIAERTVYDILSRPETAFAAGREGRADDRQIGLFD